MGMGNWVYEAEDQTLVPQDLDGNSGRAFSNTHGVSRVRPRVRARKNGLTSRQITYGFLPFCTTRARRCEMAMTRERGMKAILQRLR